MNSKPRYTRGPWVVDTDRELAYVLAGPNDTLIVCEIGTVCDQLTEVDRANARLIAAAPEMFEVLEQVHEALSMLGGSDEALELVEAVLAKARG